MKKNYIFVFMFFVTSFLSLNQSQAQEGFEGFGEGITPNYFTEVGASGAGQIGVTSEDKWVGQKSLLLYKDATANLWEPYFKVKLTYTLAPAAVLSFCAKIPATEWLHFNLADSNGVAGPEFVFLGEWQVLAQHFLPGAIPMSGGGNMTFPVDEWIKFEMTMKTGAAYDETCTLKITELEGLKRTFSNTDFTFSGRPGVVEKFNGSLKKAVLLIASDRNTSGTENGKVFIDELLIPSNSPITGAIQIDEKKMNCNIYPNPSKGYISVDSPSNIDLIQIFNIEGKAVFEKENINARQVIDLSKLSKGIYAVKMVSGKDQVTQKLILDK